MLQVARLPCADDSFASTVLTGSAASIRSGHLIHIKRERGVVRCAGESIVALQRKSATVCRVAAKKAPRVSRSIEKAAQRPV